MRKILYVIIGLLFSTQSYAQFYNGTQATYGKNRIQYHNAYWQYLRYQDFDVYYDKEGRELADFAAKQIPLIITEIEDSLQMNYPRRIIFVVCNSLQDFKETNIGLSTAEQEYNIGGVTQIIDNKVIIYYTGDHESFLKQIKKGVAELIIYQSLYGGYNYKDIISGTTSQQFPDWFIRGLISFISVGWNEEVEAHVRENIETNRMSKMIQFEGEEAVLAGVAFWEYIAQTYGYRSMNGIVYLCSITNDIDGSFYMLTGKYISQHISDMIFYYKSKLEVKNAAPIIGEKIPIPKRHSKMNITTFSVQPQEQKVAYVTEKEGQLKVWVQNENGKKRKKVDKFGFKIQQVVDETFPVLAWHPTGKILSYFYEDKGTLFFVNYFVYTKEVQKREFHYFEKVLSFDYAQNGNLIVFAGVQNGITDLYVYNTLTYDLKQITKTYADELSPHFIDSDSKIIYTTNKTVDGADSLRSDFDIHIIPLKKNAESSALIQTRHINETVPEEITKGKYVYLSNSNGVANLYYTNPDSVISQIDTIVHYSYINESFPLTNSKYNIKSFNVTNNSANLYIQTQEFNRSYIYKVSKQSLFNERPQKISVSNIKRSQDSTNSNKLLRNKIDKRTINPSLGKQTIDYNDYKFEYELHPDNVYVDSVFYANNSDIKYKSARLYQTNFYVNQVVNQVDFGIVNSSYQKFTGNEFVYVPRLNIYLKFGVIDLFEDYRLTGGVRLFGDFNSNEYIFSVENLKSRWDKQYIFHKQALNSYSDYASQTITKTFDHLLLAEFKYPFDEVQSVRITPSLRYVKDVVLSTGVQSLHEESIHENWSSVKIEYVFDNVIPNGINIYKGVRFKAFSEYYQQLNKNSHNLFVFGLDGRGYLKVHRNITLATRIAYSYSYGSSPLLYYLGSVDNWINLSLTKGKFDTDIEYDKTTNWAYQALATNMRGFRQNVRNGPSFAVMNNELRFPVVKYFSDRAIRSEIIANLQLIGFVDIGAAWNGLYPGQKENAYNFTVFGASENSPVTVKVDEMREPYVYGYGYGIRTTLLGYFVRFDWAKGIDQGEESDMFYLSLSLDF